MGAASRIREYLEAAAAVTGLNPRSSVPSAPTYLERQAWQGDPRALDYPRAAAVVPVVFACITRIANDVAKYRPTIKRVLPDGSKEIVAREPGNLVDLLARANELQSGFELERDRQASIDTSGRSYLYLERFGRKGDPPRELHLLPGHLIRPVLGPRRTILYYEWGILRTDDHVAPEDVIPFHYWNPSFDPLAPSPEGLSPLSAARQSYETRFNMGAWQSKFFSKGGNVSHIFSSKNGAPLTAERIKVLREQFGARGQGIANAFDPFFVEGMEVHRAGMTLADMRFLETSGMVDSDVCWVYGMPPEILGITRAGGSATAIPDAALAYCEGCLQPRITLRDEVLTEWLCPLFGPDLVCETDISGMLPMQKARLEQTKALAIAAGRPLLTVNEARAQAGLEPSDDETADELFVPSAGAGLPGETPTAAPGTERGTQPQAPGPGDEPNPEPVAARLAAGSEAERLAARRRADANLKRYERRVAAQVTTDLHAQEEGTLARVRVLAERAGMDTALVRFAIDGGDVFDEGDLPARQGALQTLYEALMVDRAEEAAAQVGYDLVVREWLRSLEPLVRTRVATMIGHIDDTTRAAVADAVRTSIASGSPFSELVRELRAAFEDRRGNVLTIARTETAWAYNRAAQEAWREAGVPMVSWLTVGDDVVRASHQANEAAGPLANGDAFPNGQRYPGEEIGDPGESINCRCVLQPEGLDTAPLRRFFQDGRRNGHAPARLAALFAGDR